MILIECDGGCPHIKDIYRRDASINKYATISSVCIVQGKIKKPQISIFVPTYKRAKTIRETIQSAIKQEYQGEYEIVIVSNDPDGVSNDTKRIIEEFHDERIYYYVNSQNIGLCGNWNRGLELCRAKYVAMIHDDDILSPWFLISIIQTINRYDDVTIIGVKSINFDSKKPPSFSEPTTLKYKKVTKRSFFFGRYISVAGMTVNRERVIEIGGYNEEYYPNEDTLLIYQALLNGKVINVENYLAGYRMEENLTLAEGTMEKMMEITEFTRRNIARYELFAKIFMKVFDREFLYQFITNANRLWGTSVDVENMMKEFNLREGQPNRVKMLIMKIIGRIGRL